jgi:hypothetical protein
MDLFRACFDFATEAILVSARGIFAPADRGMVVPMASEAGVKSAGSETKSERDANSKQALRYGLQKYGNFMLLL